ncbi:unnamed protein product [Ixodes hexagonus]
MFLPRAQVAYQPVKQQDAEDKFCVAEKRGASYANKPIRKPVLARAKSDIQSDIQALTDRNVTSSAPMQYSRQDKPRISRHGRRYFDSGSNSSDSLEDSEPLRVDRRAPTAHHRKTRPLVFRTSSQDKDMKTLTRHTARPPDVSDRLKKESQPIKHRGKLAASTALPSSRSSSVIDENFFGEERASEMHQAIKPSIKPRPKPKDTSGSSNGQAASQQGATLDQLRLLLDEILATENDSKGASAKAPK